MDLGWNGIWCHWVAVLFFILCHLMVNKRDSVLLLFLKEETFIYIMSLRLNLLPSNDFIKSEILLLIDSLLM